MRLVRPLLFSVLPVIVAAAPIYLIRRVAPDLIGLPPTPTEIEAFVNDEELRAPIPNAEEQKKMAELKARIAKLNEALESTSPEFEAEFHEWEAQILQKLSET